MSNPLEEIREHQLFRKGFIEGAGNDFLVKGKGLPIGTKRKHGGVEVEKTANGWVPVKGNKKSKKEDKKQSKESDKKDPMAFSDNVQAVVDHLQGKTSEERRQVLKEIGLEDEAISALADTHPAYWTDEYIDKVKSSVEKKNESDSGDKKESSEVSKEDVSRILSEEGFSTKDIKVNLVENRSTYYDKVMAKVDEVIEKLEEREALVGVDQAAFEDKLHDLIIDSQSKDFELLSSKDSAKEGDVKSQTIASVKAGDLPKSQGARVLAAEGMKTADIARELGMHYSHAYGAIKKTVNEQDSLDKKSPIVLQVKGKKGEDIGEKKIIIRDSGIVGNEKRSKIKDVPVKVLDRAFERVFYRAMSKNKALPSSERNFYKQKADSVSGVSEMVDGVEISSFIVGEGLNRVSDMSSVIDAGKDSYEISNVSEIVASRDKAFKDTKKNVKSALKEFGFVSYASENGQYKESMAFNIMPENYDRTNWSPEQQRESQVKYEEMKAELSALPEVESVTEGFANGRDGALSIKLKQ